MNAQLQSARAIAVQALAGNASQSNASEVLDFALGQISYQLQILQAACRDGLLDEIRDVSLIVLSERVESLQKFAETFLSVEFNDSEAAS